MGPESGSPAPTLRVMALDVDRFRGARAGLVRLLRDTAADVVLAHRLPTRIISSHRLGALGSDVGLVVAAGGRLAGGAGVFTTLRIEPTDTTVFTGAGGGLALVEARLTGGQRLRVATLDLHGDDAAQVALVAHLLSLLGPGDGVPTVVSGPLPGSAAGDALARRLTDLTPGGPATTPADSPLRRPAGLLGRDAVARPIDLPGEPGLRPQLLAKVLPARPTLVEVTLG